MKSSAHKQLSPSLPVTQQGSLHPLFQAKTSQLSGEPFAEYVKARVLEGRLSKLSSPVDASKTDQVCCTSAGKSLPVLISPAKVSDFEIHQQDNEQNESNIQSSSTVRSNKKSILKEKENICFASHSIKSNIFLTGKTSFPGQTTKTEKISLPNGNSKSSLSCRGTPLSSKNQCNQVTNDYLNVFSPTQEFERKPKSRLLKFSSESLGSCSRIVESCAQKEGHVGGADEHKVNNVLNSANLFSQRRWEKTPSSQEKINTAAISSSERRRKTSANSINNPFSVHIYNPEEDCNVQFRNRLPSDYRADFKNLLPKEQSRIASCEQQQQQAMKQHQQQQQQQLKVDSSQVSFRNYVPNLKDKFKPIEVNSNVNSISHQASSVLLANSAVMNSTQDKLQDRHSTLRKANIKFKPNEQPQQLQQFRQNLHQLSAKLLAVSPNSKGLLSLGTSPPSKPFNVTISSTSSMASSATTTFRNLGLNKKSFSGKKEPLGFNSQDSSISLENYFKSGDLLGQLMTSHGISSQSFSNLTISNLRMKNNLNSSQLPNPSVPSVSSAVFAQGEEDAMSSSSSAGITSINSISSRKGYSSNPGSRQLIHLPGEVIGLAETKTNKGQKDSLDGVDGIIAPNEISPQNYKIQDSIGELQTAVKEMINSSEKWQATIQQRLRMTIDQFIYLLSHFWRFCEGASDTARNNFPVFKLEEKRLNQLRTCLKGVLFKIDSLSHPKAMTFLDAFHLQSQRCILSTNILDHIGGEANARDLFQRYIDSISQGLLGGQALGVSGGEVSKLIGNILCESLGLAALNSDISKKNLCLTSVEFFLAKRALMELLSQEKFLSKSTKFMLVACVEKSRVKILQNHLFSRLIENSSSLASTLWMILRNNKPFLCSLKKKDKENIIIFCQNTFEMLFSRISTQEYVGSTIKDKLINLNNDTACNVLEVSLRLLETAIIEILSEQMDRNELQFMKKHIGIRFQFVREILKAYDEQNVMNSGGKIAKKLRKWVINNLKDHHKDIGITVTENEKLELMDSLIRLYFYRTHDIFSISDVSAAFSHFPVTQNALEFWLLGLKQVLSKSCFQLRESDIDRIHSEFARILNQEWESC